MWPEVISYATRTDQASAFDYQQFMMSSEACAINYHVTVKLQELIKPVHLIINNLWCRENLVQSTIMWREIIFYVTRTDQACAFDYQQFMMLCNQLSCDRKLYSTLHELMKPVHLIITWLEKAELYMCHYIFSVDLSPAFQDDVRTRNEHFDLIVKEKFRFKAKSIL